MPTITVLPENISVEASEGESLLEAILRAGVPHAHACGGNGLCSTCRVWVADGGDGAPPRNEIEAKMASNLGFSAELRLACQMRPNADLTVRRLVLDQEDLSLIRNADGPHPGLAGEERVAAILFADLRGFTAFSDALPAYDVIHVLHRHFFRMEQVIQRHGGVVYNYMGDGLMALFDSPDQAQAAATAVQAGLEMLQEFDQLKPYLTSAYGRSLDLGVGIHIGPMVIGTFGLGKERRLTAIGDAVNVASRIESANKEAGTRLLISQQVRDVVGDFCVMGQTPIVTIHGKAGQHQLYEVLGAQRCEGLGRV